MPIYAYACGACEREIEVLQKVSEPPLTRCPECGEEQLRKQLTAPVFRLKGNGWYETDFKKDGKKRNLADSGDGKGSSSTASSGGEAKSGESKGSDSSKSDAKSSKGGDAVAAG